MGESGTLTVDPLEEIKRTTPLRKGKMDGWEVGFVENGEMVREIPYK